MNPRELLEEALLGVRAHAARFVVSGAVCVILLTVLGWIESSSVIHLASVQQSDSMRGADVLVVTTDRGPVPAGACERLGGIGGVIAVGGLTLPVTASPDKAPRNPYQLAVVSGAYLSVADPQLETRGELFAGTNAALSLGLTAGSTISFAWGRATLADVVDTSLRVPEQSRWIYKQADWPVFVDQCWIEVARGLGPTISAALPAVMALAGSLNVETLHAGTFESRLEEWQARASEWYWVVASLVCLAPLVLNARSQRRELALYRIVGATRSNAFTLAALEVTICVSSAAVLSLGALWTITLLSETPWAESALFHGVRAITLTMGVTLAGGYVVAYRTSNASLSASMRDRG